jgi:hypothetical protein
MNSGVCSTVLVRSVRFKAKNALNQVRPNKIKKNIFRWRSLDDAVFTEFDRNFNFVPDYILPDVVALLKNL